MTDYLALADTGYSDLKTPIVPYPYRIKDFKKLDAISAMVCRAIKSAVLKDAQCNHGEVTAEDHLDISKDLPQDQTLGMTAFHQMLSYLNLRSHWFRYQYFYNGQNAVEITAAKKHFWSFELEKSDFGLNFARPASASGLKNEFAGITTAPVTAPIAYTTTFDDRARLKLSHAHTRLVLPPGICLRLHSDRRRQLYPEPQPEYAIWRKRSVVAYVVPEESGGRKPFRSADHTPPRNSSPAPREDIALSSTPPSLIPGTLRRPVDIFGKLGFRYSDEGVGSNRATWLGGA